MYRQTLIIAAGLFALPAAVAQTPGSPCPITNVPPPAELAGWAQRKELAAAVSVSRLDDAELALGEGATVALRLTQEIGYQRRPEKPGGSVSYGGMVAFRVVAAGAYRIALGSRAWIDVIRRGKALASSAHGQGPTCTGIIKIVDFNLTPGRYTLQIAGNGEQRLPILVTRRID